MNLQIQRLPAIIFHFLISAVPVQNHSLINRGEENVVYVGVFLIAIGLVAAVGIVSRKIEHALVFAIFITAVIIGFFWI
jgi:hypothetical protein